MTHFLSVALAFPAVVYTVLLGVALVYWVFVMVGALHVNILGEGLADGVGDAGLDGVAKGALEGATKGMLEGAAEHLEGGHLDGGDGDIGDVADGGPGGVLAALKLRSAPATVVLSAILLFAWIFCILGMQWSTGIGGIAGTVIHVLLFVLAPILALFPASICVRPLARVFTPPNATKNVNLVGQLCRIRTGTVTDRFGEATLEDGGAGLVVRVRVESGEKLARGEQAVIVGYDPDRQEFTVAPFESGLEEDMDRPAGSRKAR